MRKIERVALPVAYRLGFENWDSQHSIIISLLQEAVTCRNKKGQILERCIDEIYQELMLYTQNHFKYEEKMMKKISYEGANLHIEQHLFFIEKVKELYFKESSNREKAILKLAQFLKSWFLTHIQSLDKKVAEAVLMNEFEKDQDLERIPVKNKKGV